MPTMLKGTPPHTHTHPSLEPGDTLPGKRLGGSCPGRGSVLEVGKEWGDPCLGRSSVWGGRCHFGGD